MVTHSTTLPLYEVGYRFYENDFPRRFECRAASGPEAWQMCMDQYAGAQIIYVIPR